MCTYKAPFHLPEMDKDARTSLDLVQTDDKNVVSVWTRFMQQIAALIANRNISLFQYLISCYVGQGKGLGKNLVLF